MTIKIAMTIRAFPGVSARASDKAQKPATTTNNLIEEFLVIVCIVSGNPVFLILEVQLLFLVIKEAMIFPHWHKSGTSEEPAALGN